MKCGSDTSDKMWLCYNKCNVALYLQKKWGSFTLVHFIGDKKEELSSELSLTGHTILINTGGISVVYNFNITNMVSNRTLSV